VNGLSAGKPEWGDLASLSTGGLEKQLDKMLKRVGKDLGGLSRPSRLRYREKRLEASHVVYSHGLVTKLKEGDR